MKDICWWTSFWLFMLFMQSCNMNTTLMSINHKLGTIVEQHQ